MQKGRPRGGQLPKRGAVEVQAVDEDVRRTVESDQVRGYQARYVTVLVSNQREFVLFGEDVAGRPTKLETLRLAETEDAFWRKVEKPRVFARDAGAKAVKCLSRVLSHCAALAEPKDLAPLQASYARDGLARVKAAGDALSVAAVRAALEEAFGARVEGERIFNSTLV